MIEVEGKKYEMVIDTERGYETIYTFAKNRFEAEEKFKELVNSLSYNVFDFKKWTIREV